MPTFKKYPVYSYDEPATYSNFAGGINTDPSNENLLINELRNAVNIHYTNGTPRNRFGATKLLDIESEEDINNIQGIFLYTNINSYIIVAANGKLYYSLYFPNTTIYLHRLHIYREDLNNEDEQNYLDQFSNLDEHYQELEDVEHNGYVLKQDNGVKELIFQNTRKIESASYKSKLYIATGTRLTYIYIKDEEMFARVITPYQPSGIEMQQIGVNLLSPFPNHCVERNNTGAKTSIHGVIPTLTTDGVYRLDAVMSYEQGKNANDYIFKWEKITSEGAEPVTLYGTDELPLIYNSKIGENNQAITRGRSSINVSSEDMDRYIYRCSFAESFKRDTAKETQPFILETISYGTDKSYKDFVVDKLDGAWFGSATSVNSTSKTDYNSFWKEIQSCTKITSDGNKFILYDDIYNSGNWWKTVIDNPSYITYRGSLNFKTDKNEKVIKVIQFKGIIVVFCYNELVGGNISIVTGNGDDYQDQNYSPYIRKVVNTNVGCDNAHTVQVADNMILFKYKDTIYMIEGSQFNSEIIEVQSVNDKLKMFNGEVYIPWDDNNCISEITDDYYALIWQERLGIENNQVYIDRPAMRIKMYYKLGALDQNNRVIFPWLIDESKTFNTNHILYIAGISTHLYKNILIQYNKPVFTDLGEKYESKLHLRAVDVNYPKLIKYINSIILYYYRGTDTVMDMKIVVRNEAGHIILNSKLDVTEQDFKVLGQGGIIDEKTRLDRTILDSKVFNIPYKFPCLLSDVTIIINNGSDFSLSSITYNYMTTELPDRTQFDEYKKFLRKEFVGITLKDKIQENKIKKMLEEKNVNSNIEDDVVVYSGESTTPNETLNGGSAKEE